MQLKEGSILQGGKYVIIRTLGQGGFGITYLAEQIALHRRVAIKEFFMKEYCERNADTSQVTLGATEGSKDLVARFRTKFIREAQMIAGLEHPNIVKIHDVFEENGTAYYVMEYLDGGSLSERIKKQGYLSEEEAIMYISQVGNALSNLHKHNCLHFDVKPANILLNKSGGAVLIDFGVSKHYDEGGGQTSSTPVGISKGYAPLEQYQQSEISTFTPATDIYSLGATLYTLVTGDVPPSASEVYEDGLPSKPQWVSKGMYNAVESAMQPRRKDRPQSVSSFLSLLGKHVELQDEKEEVTEEVTVVKIPVENNNDISVHKAHRDNTDGLVSNNEEQKSNDDERFPMVTRISLIVLCILIFTVFVFSIIWCKQQVVAWDRQGNVVLLLGAFGALIAFLGMLLILFKWRFGFWTLILGGVFSIIMEAGSETGFDSEIWGLVAWNLLYLSIIVLVTWGVLRIKNNCGITGWTLLRHGLPRYRKFETIVVD